MIRAALLCCLAFTPVLAADQVPSAAELRLPQLLDRALRDYADSRKTPLDESFRNMSAFEFRDLAEHDRVPVLQPDGRITVRGLRDSDD